MHLRRAKKPGELEFCCFGLTVVVYLLEVGCLSLDLVGLFFEAIAFIGVDDLYFCFAFGIFI